MSDDVFEINGSWEAEVIKATEDEIIKYSSFKNQNDFIDFLESKKINTKNICSIMVSRHVSDFGATITIYRNKEAIDE